MSLQTRVLDLVMGLPSATTTDVTVTRGIHIPMPDGVELVGDLYRPNLPDAPTVMSRTPYGRTGMVSRCTAMPFAQRGFNVFIQSCRGTHGGSGGVFDPLVNEEKDGLATLDWIERQSWYNGKLFLFGPSYVGYTQWALAVAAGGRVTGLLPTCSSTNLSEALYTGDTFVSCLAVQWIRRMVLTEFSPHLADVVELVGDRRAQKAMWTLPVDRADRAATGRRIDFFQTWLNTPRSDVGYWNGPRDHRDRIGDVTAQVHLFAAWHDFLAPSQLDDYIAMRAAGLDPFLTVGPWKHVDDRMLFSGVKEGLDWFAAVAADDPTLLREHRVRLFVQGAQQWREYDHYPPTTMRPRVWQLHPEGGFSPDDLSEGTTRRFTYDPSDPTPDVGGAVLDGRQAGVKDQSARESRADVLVYTSAPLTNALEIIGPVSAEIKVWTNYPNADVFVRLCDVDRNGISRNVCDGIQRTTGISHPGDDLGIFTVAVRMWPTAYRFKPGHRLRVQVCGGSFPRFVRNTGTTEPVPTATRLVPVDFEIFPTSSVTLPEVP